MSRYLQPQITIQHNYPGASYTVPSLHEIDEDRHASDVKAVIESRYVQPGSCTSGRQGCDLELKRVFHHRFTPGLNKRGIPHLVHIHMDTDNAPASAISGCAEKEKGQSATMNASL